MIMSDNDRNHVRICDIAHRVYSGFLFEDTNAICMDYVVYNLIVSPELPNAEVVSDLAFLLVAELGDMFCVGH